MVGEWVSVRRELLAENNGAPTMVSSGGAEPATIAAANGARRQLVIRYVPQAPPSLNPTVYLGYGDGVGATPSNAPIALEAGGVGDIWVEDRFRGAMWALTGGATTVTLAVQEVTGT